VSSDFVHFQAPNLRLFRRGSGVTRRFCLPLAGDAFFFFPRVLSLWIIFQLRQLVLPFFFFIVGSDMYSGYPREETTRPSVRRFFLLSFTSFGLVPLFLIVFFYTYMPCSPRPSFWSASYVPLAVTTGALILSDPFFPSLRPHVVRPLTLTALHPWPAIVRTNSFRRQLRAPTTGLFYCFLIFQRSPSDGFCAASLTDSRPMIWTHFASGTSPFFFFPPTDNLRSKHIVCLRPGPRRFFFSVGPLNRLKFDNS